jgi:hypothetical protein
VRAPAVIVAVFAAACSRPTAPPPRQPASPSPPARATGASRAVPPSNLPRSERVLVDEPADEALESRLEHAEVDGVGIKIEVSWWTLTGTTHVAEALAITTARGTLRLESRDEDDDAPALPLVEQVYSAGPSRWVVLGWSSFGGGMQTEHVWLVDGKGAPRIADKLAWTTDRKHAGLAIDVTKTVLVGIPLPQRSHDDNVDDDDDDSSLHEEGDWSLVHGMRSFTLEQVAHLPSDEQSLMTLRHYTPPAHDGPSNRGWTGRFVWFSAGKQFVLQRQ